MARGWARSNEEEVPHPFVLVRGRGVGRNFTGDEPWRRRAPVVEGNAATRGSAAR